MHACERTHFMSLFLSPNETFFYPICVGKVASCCLKGISPTLLSKLPTLTLLWWSDTGLFGARLQGGVDIVYTYMYMYLC